MKTPAVIASLTIVGSIAYAAGQSGTGKQPPLMLSGAKAHSIQEELPEARIAQADCPSGVPLNWFSPTPNLVPCAGGFPPDVPPLLTAISGPVDVNGDGVLEFWGALADPNGSGIMIYNGTPTFYSRKIWVNRLDPISGAPTSIRDAATVVPSDFGVWLQAMFPGTQFAEANLGTNGDPNGNVYLGGFRDMDGDGDLDYLVMVSTNTQQRQVWFENIGFEKPTPPVAADLNRDGKVDGADLGLLLVAWGPNP